MKPRAILILATTTLIFAAPAEAGTFDEFVLTGQTPTAPLSNPVPTVSPLGVLFLTFLVATARFAALRR